jgi:undecaprenyl-diphosphatase
LDVNRFARSTSWAHGFAKAYYQRVTPPVGAGVLVMALVLVLAWWSARRSPGHVAAVIWAAGGAAGAYGLSVLVDGVLAQSRPYVTMKHVEVLVRGSPTFGFPDGRTAVVGAVVCGLVLARRWLLLVVAVLAGLLLALTGVYVGADYPSDSAGGAVFGAVVVLVLWPVVSVVLGAVVARTATSRLGVLVEARRPGAGYSRMPSPTRLPDARAMDALKAATEAARSQPPAPPPERDRDEQPLQFRLSPRPARGSPATPDQGDSGAP